MSHVNVNRQNKIKMMCCALKS